MSQGTIDSRGRAVLPCGVDSHVHLAMPAGSLRTSDDFASGSRAALRGGTAALVDFVEAEGGEPLLSALDARLVETATSVVPVKLRMTISGWRGAGGTSTAGGTAAAGGTSNAGGPTPCANPEYRRIQAAGTAAEMAACVERGIGCFKIYLAYLDSIGVGDAVVRKVLETAHALGASVLVHAEDGPEVDRLRAYYLSRGETAPRYHALSRPAEGEARAIAKIVSMVQELGGPRVVIAHVSSALGLGEIIKAKSLGLPVYAETCPQYLAFTADAYEAPPGQAALFVMSPPLRSQKDREFLWSALADGAVDFISTDHCPFTTAEKTRWADDFTRIPNGAGGIAERMAYVLTEGHVRRGIGLQRLFGPLCTNAAAFYGFAKSAAGLTAGPAVGSVGGGSAAGPAVASADGPAAGPAAGPENPDCVLWSFGEPYRYSRSLGGGAGDHSLYEGMEFIAMPEEVYVAGKLRSRKWKSTAQEEIG